LRRPNQGRPSGVTRLRRDGLTADPQQAHRRRAFEPVRRRGDIATRRARELDREVVAVQSSRRLEDEAGRNVEVMWLTGRLAPDHKTIADFRKDNGRAIRQVCARFVALCRTMGLLTEASVAIDGSKFKAVNNRDKNFTRAKMELRTAQIEESIARYLQQLDTADRQEPSETLKAKVEHLKDKIAKLKEQMQRLHAIAAQMLAMPDQQISLTDPDARSMATSGRGSGVVGYNVQIAVDIDIT
jgi:rubrerythrin